VLFSPEAHQALADEPWSIEKARAAIDSIVADVESAFDDGWPLHPQDEEPGDDPATRFRSVHVGGAGVVAALHRLERRGFAPAVRGRGGGGRELAAYRGQGISRRDRDGRIRTQWCHGAPGIVATLAHVLGEDLAVAGGELTWRAGPLRKGANLCHGTAGNGYAFLALLERTGDERWLTRARAFAMHAVRQVEQSRFAYGRGRYTLWTVDPGTALYLADCIDGGGKPPLP
jgi:hypothetical protein